MRNILRFIIALLSIIVFALSGNDKDGKVTADNKAVHCYITSSDVVSNEPLGSLCLYDTFPICAKCLWNSNCGGRNEVRGRIFRTNSLENHILSLSYKSFASVLSVSLTAICNVSTFLRKKYFIILNKLII